MQEIKNSTMNTTKTTYDEMIMKQKIAPILGLEADGQWEIVSESDTGLVMVHYSTEANTDILGALRGVVVDTNKGNIVCYSYPHATSVVTSNLNVVDNVLQLSPTLSLNMDNIHIKMGFEGTLIHVFKHDGKVYRSTRKRLDSSKSRWGNSKTFGQIYQELKGPSDEMLFNSEKKYSPYCHTFILVHPDVLIATKLNVEKGFLVYLGPKQMYSKEEGRCPYPLNEVDTELKTPLTSNVFPSDLDNKVYVPSLLNLEEANKHLLFGVYEPFEGYEHIDPRLLPGEFLILEDVSTKLMYKVESPAYHWRTSMRNNNPNLLHRFFELLDYAHAKNLDNQKYVEMFSVLTMYNLESLQTVVSTGPLIVWPQIYNVETSIPDTRDAKLYNIWQNFLISVPLKRQKEVLEFYTYLTTRRDELTNWFCQLSERAYSRKENMEAVTLTDLSKRSQDILVKTRTFAEDRVRKGQNFDPKTKEKKNVDFWTAVNIRNFINKELGSSLYRLIKEMDRYNNPKTEM